MSYFFSMIGYFWVYIIVYVAPVLLIVLGVQELERIVVIPNFVEDVLRFVGGIAFFLGLGVAGYRSNIAAKCQSTENATFCEAHKYSGAMVRAMLAFLPIVGGWFEKKEKDQGDHKTR